MKKLKKAPPTATEKGFHQLIRDQQGNSKSLLKLKMKTMKNERE